MAPIKWNAEIAQTAQAHANNCKFQHAPQSQRMYNGKTLGENLSFGSPYDYYGTAKMVKLWEDEKKDYTYPAGPDSKTGHYTQIINKGVTEIGCACSKCNGNEKICVCRYDFAQYGSKPPY